MIFTRFPLPVRAKTLKEAYDAKTDLATGLGDPKNLCQSWFHVTWATLIFTRFPLPVRAKTLKEASEAKTDLTTGLGDPENLCQSWFQLTWGKSIFDLLTQNLAQRVKRKEI